MSIGIKKNDEIITVSNTAVPTVCAIVSCGAKPVYVDINEKDYLIDVSLIERKITKKTKALLIPVNLYGQSANYLEINRIAKKYNLKLLRIVPNPLVRFIMVNQVDLLVIYLHFSFIQPKI